MKEDNTVHRYTLEKNYDNFGLIEADMEQDDEGKWVSYDEHLSSITDLEYEIRYLKEEITELKGML